MFNNEIAAGNIPDIVMWGEYNGFPIQSYKEKGLFRDLYELMGKDIDLLMPFAYKPFEDNGKLYQFSTNVGFATYAGKKSLFPKTPMTPMEMINYENSLGADQHLHDGLWNLYYSERTVLDFVDNENHKVYFDSDEFIAILSHPGKTPPERDPDDRYAQYRNDTIQLYRTTLRTFDDYMSLKFIFRDDVTFVGYPTLSENGATARAFIMFGITEKSKHAEMAWQFLKRTLADDIQFPLSAQRSNIANYFPMTVGAMDKYIDNMLNRIYVFFDDRGWTSYPKPLPEDARQGYMLEITREEIDYVLDYMASAKAVNTEDYSFLFTQIIFEEMQYSKPPEEIAKVIQSRASIYISERQ